MRLIVGLGNPGKEYEKTRHNVGFNILDKYINYKNVDTKWKEKFNGLYIESNINGEKVIFLKPQSYMNLSGGVVRKFIDFFKIDIDDILIISDDLDLNVGNYKLKDTGTSGGHNGLKDIESNIGTKDYKRLKIGISNNKGMDTKDYVLGKLSKEDRKAIDNLFDEIKLVIDDYFDIDFPSLMNKYNRKNR